MSITKPSTAQLVEAAQVEIGEKLDLIAERRTFKGSTNALSTVVYHRWAKQPAGIGTVTMPIFETACGLSVNDCPMPARLTKARVGCGTCAVSEAELEQASAIIARYKA